MKQKEKQFKKRFKYAVEGTVVPSVTTVLNILAKPALIEWAWKLGMEGIDYKQVRSAEADVGTVAHEMIRYGLLDMSFDTSAYPPDTVRRAENAFNAWLEWKRQNHIEPIAIEEPIAFKELMVGGTPDLIARSNGETILIDFKTSSGATIYPEMIIQSCVYAYMMPYIINKVFIFRLGKDDGSLMIYQISEQTRTVAVNLFTHLREVYELIKEIK